MWQLGLCFFFFQFGPCVAQCDCAVEHGARFCAVLVFAEVAQAFELHSFAGLQIAECRFQHALYNCKRVGIEVVQKGFSLWGFVGVFYGEQLVVQAYIGGYGVGC